MLKKIISKALRHRYFWRDAGFDELTELYISNMLRAFALSILMVFVPFYLYQNGYAVTSIFVTFASYFAIRCIFDFVAGYFIARYGPKHAMIVSCMLQIVNAAMLASVPAFHWSSWLIGVPWGMAASFYFTSYHVEFSKIKHTDHAGKEIGFMNVVERGGAVLGPLVGGITGTLFGARYIFLMAVIVLIGSLWPLFMTREPVKTRQKLRFRSAPLPRIRKDILPYAAMGLENTLCMNLWPLYLSLFALGSGVYAKLGALSSLSVGVSILSAYAIGKFIDRRSARSVLRVSALINAGLYILRPLVHSVYPAFAINVANDLVTTGYRIPFTKGVYAAADDLPGYRIVYIVTMEFFSSVIKATAWGMLALLATLFSPFIVIIIGFVMAALGSLLITTERFKALDPKTIMSNNHG